MHVIDTGRDASKTERAVVGVLVARAKHARMLKLARHIYSASETQDQLDCTGRVQMYSSLLRLARSKNCQGGTYACVVGGDSLSALTTSLNVDGPPGLTDIIEICQTELRRQHPSHRSTRDCIIYEPPLPIPGRRPKFRIDPGTPQSSLSRGRSSAGRTRHEPEESKGETIGRVCGARKYRSVVQREFHSCECRLVLR